jgi:hypothetical protein
MPLRVQQVYYLGFSVNSGGILPDESKVRAIMDSTAPTNLTQLRSFLGLVGLYRRFIKDFSNKAEPLIALARKGAAFFWSSTCDTSFHALKNALSSATMLQYPDFNKEFSLTTDASDAGVGAILSQKDDSHLDRPIAFASRRLSKTTPPLRKRHLSWSGRSHISATTYGDANFA